MPKESFILLTIFNDLLGLILGNHGIGWTLDHFLIALLRSSHGNQNIQPLLGMSSYGLENLFFASSIPVSHKALACMMGVFNLGGVLGTKLKASEDGRQAM